MATTTTHNFECRDLPLEQVTVFNDRGELKRTFKVSAVAGINEVVVKNASNMLIYDSVRVNGRGKATIHEVSVDDKPAMQHEADSDEMKKLRGELKALEDELAGLEDEKAALDKQSSVLDDVVSKVGNSIVAPPKEGSSTSFSLDDTTTGNLVKFMGFYKDQSVSVRAAARDVNKKIGETREAVNKKNNEINQRQFTGHIKCITVVLEAEAETEVELDVIYQVHNAFWRPSYDVRVESAGEGAVAKTTMQVSYHGNVQQSTGEEWNPRHLILSTARPCVGGEIPELGTLDASFYRPPPPQPEMMRRTMMRNSAVGACGAMPQATAFSAAPITDNAQFERTLVQNKYADVSESALSTEFKVARVTAIPSERSDHKVSIGVVSLEPQLVHECVPSRSTAVFLTASALNASQLPFLPGEAAIYLDGSFVAKIQMKSVSPGERFVTSLGVDPAIKVEYKPAHKNHEQTGLINKQSTTSNEQKVSVKNARAEKIRLTIKEHVPRATDEKIKVRLVAPEARPMTDEEANEPAALPPVGARMNKANNLEWTVEMGAKASQQLTIKWAIDHPPAEKLVFNEKF